MIANAEIGKDGRLIDKGNLKIDAARMIPKILHDYDEGMILGIGVYMQVSGNRKTGESKTSFDKMSLSVDYRDCRCAERARPWADWLCCMNELASSLSAFKYSTL